MASWNKGQSKSLDWLKAHVSYAGDDCLVWPFCRDGRVGRGRAWDGKRGWWAHRLMCVLAHGDPPTPKHQAAHNCGKGHYGCVNPRHLEWKTNSENQLDRRKNGNMLRNPHGSRGGLTPEQKAEIVALKGQMTQMAIAAKFGVSLGCVQYWHKVRAERGHDVPKHHSFTPAEDAYILDQLAAGYGTEDIAIGLGLSRGSIQARSLRLRRKLAKMAA